jgi:hypothetical protein
MAGRNISATVIMINIPAHNPQNLYVLYENSSIPLVNKLKTMIL